MRKIFFFFAAMLTALAVNAATTTVHNTNFKNNLKTAVAAATAGDVLELEDGIYYEEGNFDMKKNLTIKAASGAHPVIANLYYFRVEGANVTFQGIEFDGAIYKSSADATVTGASDHCVRSYKTGDGNEDLVFEDCEFHGYKSYVLYTHSEARKWHSLTVRNCYFHDNIKHAIAVNHEADGGGSCDILSVENSTFANTTGDYRAILIQSGNTTTLSVNNCTFYNYYGHFIELGSDVATATISNSIFANPSAKSAAAISASTGAVTNCLAYNTGAYTGVTTDATDITGDPLFQDAANGDFTLGDNSPALAAGTNKSDLGDPRWAKPKTLYCYVDKGWWIDGSAAVNCYAKKEGVAELAAWPGVAMTEVETNLWKIELSRKFDKINFVRVNPADKSDYWGAKTAEMNVPTNSNLFTITSDDAQWDSESKTAAGTWSVKDAKFHIAGSMTNWENDPIGSLTDSYTLSLGAGKHQLKVVDNGNWLGMSSMTDVAGGLYQDASGAICLQLAAAGDVVVTFVKDGENIDTYTVTGDFTAPSVALAGEMTTWTAADLATYNFTPAIDKKSASWQYTPTALPASDSNYAFKVVFDGDQWLSNNGYWITRENHSVSALGATGEGENLIFRPDVLNKAYTFTWTYATGTLDVTFPADTPSAIDNTDATVKAAKVFRDGQVLIIRDGKTYNVIGLEVR